LSTAAFTVAYSSASMAASSGTSARLATSPCAGRMRSTSVIATTRSSSAIQLSTEVSELSNTNAFTQATTTGVDSNGNTVVNPGITIPALNVRRAETTVELPSGGSFAIAGLMQHTTKQSIDALPGLKELPVLGALFRSRDFQNNESELVVLISAYLVSPTAEARLTTPVAGFQPPSDIDTIINGKINNTHGITARAPASALSQGDTGFIVR